MAENTLESRAFAYIRFPHSQLAVAREIKESFAKLISAGSLLHDHFNAARRWFARFDRMKISTGKRSVIMTLGAFALAEIMIAVGIIGVMFVALYLGLSSGFGVVQLARENLRGTQILQEKMETIRLYTWEQLTKPGFIPTNFVEDFFASTGSVSGLTYTGTVSIATAPVTEVYSNDLKLVTITVKWKSGGVLRTREMVTFVAKNGLQNYIY